ncbi:MAG: hypothetical protein WDZ76_14555 [Pseudohongiellaceae bacterium]
MNCTLEDYDSPVVCSIIAAFSRIVCVNQGAAVRADNLYVTPMETEKNPAAREPLGPRLTLPVPNRLHVPAMPGSTNRPVKQAAIALLSAIEQDPLSLQGWSQALSQFDAPAVTSELELSHKQQVYDEYFNVARHEGSTDLLLAAIAQVVSELTLEFSDSKLQASEISDRLLDGLKALLETLCEN